MTRTSRPLAATPRRVLCRIGAMLGLLTTTVAAAQTPDGAPRAPPVSLDSVDQKALTADWGPRARAAEEGITFNVHFIGERRCRHR